MLSFSFLYDSTETYKNANQLKAGYVYDLYLTFIVFSNVYKVNAFKNKSKYSTYCVYRFDTIYIKHAYSAFQTFRQSCFLRFI